MVGLVVGCSGVRVVVAVVAALCVAFGSVVGIGCEMQKTVSQGVVGTWMRAMSALPDKPAAADYYSRAARGVGAPIQHLRYFYL